MVGVVVKTKNNNMYFQNKIIENYIYYILRFIYIQLLEIDSKNKFKYLLRNKWDAALIDLDQ